MSKQMSGTEERRWRGACHDPFRSVYLPIVICCAQAARFLSVTLFLRFVLTLVSERVDRIKPSRALLTASSFGKAFATCGSSTTTFVDSRMRFAYLPYASLPKS